MNKKSIKDKNRIIIVLNSPKMKARGVSGHSEAGGLLSRRVRLWLVKVEPGVSESQQLRRETREIVVRELNLKSQYNITLAL